MHSRNVRFEGSHRIIASLRDGESGVFERPNDVNHEKRVVGADVGQRGFRDGTRELGSCTADDSRSSTLDDPLRSTDCSLGEWVVGDEERRQQLGRGHIPVAVMLWSRIPQFWSPSST